VTLRPALVRPAAVALLALTLLVVVAADPVPAGAQDGEVPTQDIIPEPNSGEAPDEAGDRGGSLQLAVFALVVAAIVGGGAYVALQARRAREGRGQPSASSARMASQAATPSTNPER
jgi:uncharacterized protein HemX